MSESKPGMFKNRKILLALVAIPLAIALVPPLMYGGFIVPVSAVTFSETTGSLTYGNVQHSVEQKSAYEYMMIKSGGMVRTTDSDVSSSRGTATITMSLRLRNPSGQTVELGNMNISGAMGTRTHTLYLGADEGVRLPGDYQLSIDITAQVVPVAGIQTNLTITVLVDFTVN